MPDDKAQGFWAEPVSYVGGPVDDRNPSLLEAFGVGLLATAAILTGDAADALR